MSEIVTSAETNSERGESIHQSLRPSIVIDCGTCVMRRTSTCGDCMVTALLDDDGRRHTDGAVVFDLAEYRAVRLLADAGLVPSLRHREAEATG